MHCGHAGRNAGELPLAPTMPVYTTNCTLVITTMLHRVAVGATGRSPETHALRTRRTQRGRASTRPYNAGIYHPDNAPYSSPQCPCDACIDNARGRQNHEDLASKSLSSQKLTLQISNIAMTIDRRLKKAAIIAIECILCSAFYMVVYNFLSERILHVTKPYSFLFLNGVALFFFFWGVDKLYRRFSRHKKARHGRK